MSAASAVMIAAAAKRHRLIRRFLDAQAFTPESAILADSLPHADHLLRMLREQGVVRVAPDGRLYLDPARLDSVGRAKRATALRWVLVAVVGVVGLSVLSYTLASH